MALLTSDNFSSYTPGSQNPTGWTSQNGDPNIVNFGTMTGSTSSSGFYERLGQGAQVVGDMIYQTTGAAYTAIQFNWMNWTQLGGNTQISFDNANLSTPGVISYTPLCNFDIQNDMTVSFWINNPSGTNTNQPIAISNEQLIYPFNWHYFQGGVNIGQIVLSSGTFLQISGTLAIDGTLALTGTGVSNIQPSQLWTDSANSNQIRITGHAFYNRYIGDMAAYVGTFLPIGQYQFGTSPINNRFTQGVVEVTGNRPRNARMTQGVVELPKYPAQRNLRFTQGVVEFVGRRTPLVWVVYEA